MRLTTSNPLHGRTLNPWHSDASPGGSSGGAGSACAAGFGPLHHGNDIGGSLRFPAFCNGVATIKPTQGRVPGFSPSSTAERGVLSQLMSSQGVICRSIADVRLATRVMAELDPRDPWQVPVLFDGPRLDGPITVAVTRNAHGYPIHPRIVEQIDRAAGALADAGYRVIEAEPPPITEAYAGWWSTGITEIKLTLDATARQHGSAELQQVFDDYYAMGDLLDLAGYRAGFSERTRMMREWSVFTDAHPIVLTPFLMRPTYAWDADAHGIDAVADLFMSSMYSCGLNFLGFPAGVLPTGMVDNLPAGVQLVGRRFREDLVLDAMQSIEDRLGRLTPPT
jgi:amidase